MARLPVHREPKPQPRRRSRGHEHHVHDHQVHDRAHSSSGHKKRRIGTFQGHVIAATGEFVGTFMFLYFSFACQTMLVTQAGEKSVVNGLASSQQNIFTALVYGLSLLVNAWAFYRISGGLFNPAVGNSSILIEAIQNHTNPSTTHGTDNFQGDTRYGASWNTPRNSRSVPFPCATLGRYVRWRSSSGHVSGRYQYHQYHSLTWD